MSTRTNLCMTQEIETMRTKVDEKFKAYCAGFFDGEGSVSIILDKRVNVVSKRYRIKVTLWQKDRQVLDLIKSIYGGNIYTYERVEKKWKIKRTCSQLNFADQMAENFLIDIYPYIVVKKSKVKLALESRLKIREWGRNRNKKELIKILNGGIEL